MGVVESVQTAITLGKDPATVARNIFRSSKLSTDAAVLKVVSQAVGTTSGIQVWDRSLRADEWPQNAGKIVHPSAPKKSADPLPQIPLPIMKWGLTFFNLEDIYDLPLISKTAREVVAALGDGFWLDAALRAQRGVKGIYNNMIEQTSSYTYKSSISFMPCRPHEKMAFRAEATNELAKLREGVENLAKRLFIVECCSDDNESHERKMQMQIQEAESQEFFHALPAPTLCRLLLLHWPRRCAKSVEFSYRQSTGVMNNWVWIYQGDIPDDPGTDYKYYAALVVHLGGRLLLDRRFAAVEKAEDCHDETIKQVEHLTRLAISPERCRTNLQLMVCEARTLLNAPAISLTFANSADDPAVTWVDIKFDTAPFGIRYNKGELPITITACTRNAESLGVKAGMVLRKIDGQSLDAMSFESVYALLQETGKRLGYSQ